MAGNENGAEQAAPSKVQRTFKLSELQSAYVALSQREHNRLTEEVKALVARANAVQSEAVGTLRRAVEGSFREGQHPIPTAEVRIVNNEQGMPAVFVWEEAAPTEADGEAETPDAPVETEAAPAKANGKFAPEAAKRKLPLNK